MADSSEINRLLCDRFEELCQLLLPQGKRRGNHWLVGDLSGSPGESLQITISGSAAGRFVDFANPEVKGATPLYLWHKVKGCSFKEAVVQAKDWLGIRDEDYGIKRHKAKTYSPVARDTIRPTESNTEVMDYLTMTRRLDPRVVVAARVCETEDGKSVVFPYYEHDTESGKDKVVHRKYLKIERPNGKKDMQTTKGTKRCLYGKHMIGDNANELVVCEGEIDALSWHSWSIPAVSMPNGVSDMEWIEIDWDWLARFERIYISTDMDEPGRGAAQELCKRLGLHRCYIVELPQKDANDCLTNGISREEMLGILAKAKAIEMDEIKHPDEFTNEVLEHFQKDPEDEGFETPWMPAVPWRLRRSEFTIFSGFSGSGKTNGLNQLMLHLVKQGLRVMDASLEIKPGMTLYNMTRCALAKKHAKREEIEGCINWINDSMFFLDCIGTVSVNRLMHAMEYARKRHGIDVFVIDSLFKCGLSSEDYGAQREFADKLTTFCNNTGAHVILVAHSRKTQNGNEFAVPTKSDVAGSSDLVNAAFNVIIFWRNKEKKRKLDEARQKFPPDQETINKYLDAHDGKIVLDKQRFGGGVECETMTWYNHDAQQFHPVKRAPIAYFSANSS